MLKLKNKKGSLAQISESFENLKTQFIAEVIEVMAYVGEEFVKDAKTNLHINKSVFSKGNYQDQTSNLRSSIGYYILHNDKVVKYKLEPLANMSIIRSLFTRRSRKGLRLVVVAGMEYASYVESKGYNVITSQADVAFVDLKVDLTAVAKRYGIKLR